MSGPIGSILSGLGSLFVVSKGVEMVVGSADSGGGSSDDSGSSSSESSSGSDDGE